MAQDLVEIFVAAGLPEANLIKSYLEANGIPVMAVQEGAGAAYGLTVGIMGEVRLLVTKQWETRARELIEAMQAGTADTSSEESSPDINQPE